MKNIVKMGLAATALVCAAGQTNAATLIISPNPPGVVHGDRPTGNIYYPSNNTSGTPITPQSVNGTIDSTLDGTVGLGAISLFTYCIDLKQFSGTGSFNVVSLLSFLGNDVSLYNKFAALIAAHGAQGTTAQDAAVQMAVWELFYETSSTLDVMPGATQGVSYVTGLSVPADGTLANSYLASASLNAAAHPEIKIWVAQNNEKQDLLFWTYTAVPEPATWGMMMLGLGAVGYAMRRRQQTVVSFS